MFKELAQMLGEGDGLVITVVALKEGRMALTVLPKGDFKNKDLGAGLALEATPEEFDAGLAEHLTGYVNQRKSLKEQIETQTLVLAEAERESKAATAKAISKATAGKAAPATKKAEPVKSAGGDEGGDGQDDEGAAGGGNEATGAAGGSEQGGAPTDEISLF
ncbi:MAG: PRTRC system protein E [Gammaproteobacteria bacterium]